MIDRELLDGCRHKSGLCLEALTAVKGSLTAPNEVHSELLDAAQRVDAIVRRTLIAAPFCSVHPGQLQLIVSSQMAKDSPLHRALVRFALVLDDYSARVRSLNRSNELATVLSGNASLRRNLLERLGKEVLSGACALEQMFSESVLSCEQQDGMCFCRFDVGKEDQDSCDTAVDIEASGLDEVDLEREKGKLKQWGELRKAEDKLASAMQAASKAIEKSGALASNSHDQSLAPSKESLTVAKAVEKVVGEIRRTNGLRASSALPPSFFIKLDEQTSCRDIQLEIGKLQTLLKLQTSFVKAFSDYRKALKKKEDSASQKIDDAVSKTKDSAQICMDALAQYVVRSGVTFDCDRSHALVDQPQLGHGEEKNDYLIRKSNGGAAKSSFMVKPESARPSTIPSRVADSRSPAAHDNSTEIRPPRSLVAGAGPTEIEDSMTSKSQTLHPPVPNFSDLLSGGTDRAVSLERSSRPDVSDKSASSRVPEAVEDFFCVDKPSRSDALQVEPAANEPSYLYNYSSEKTAPKVRLIDSGSESLQAPMQPLFGIRSRTVVSLVDAITTCADAGMFEGLIYPPHNANAIPTNFGPHLIQLAAKAVRMVESRFSSGNAEDGIPYGLTEQEAAALFLYTVECPFYHQVNNLLRQPDRSMCLPLFDYLRLFLSAADKLPKHQTTVYRGIMRAHSELTPAGSYAEGARVEMWQITSTARVQNKILDFVGKTGGRTIMTLECKHAIDIRPFSCFGADESEYILIPGTEFSLISVMDAGNGLTLLQLTEDSCANFAANLL